MDDQTKKEKAAAYYKTYNEVHKEEIAARRKVYREVNREKILESKKSYREYNKEEVAARKKEYRRLNKEKVAEASKKYRLSNPEKVKAWEKEWRAIPTNVVKSRAGQIKSRYGISMEDLSNMLDEQKGCCKVCGDSLIYPDSKVGYRIDHCHTTGKVRGLLCHNCNIALGHLKDNIDTLERMIDYLKA